MADCYRGYVILRFFRADCAFADPNVYCYLEAVDYFYAILFEKIERLLTRRVGRPPKQPIVLYKSFRYQAASWDKPRRVVAKVEWHIEEFFQLALLLQAYIGNIRM